MKKFRNLSLFVATFLASFLIYSCMKDEVITQQPVALEQLQAQTLTSNTDSTLPIVEQKKIKELLSLKPTVIEPNVTTQQLSSLGPDDCASPPKDGGGCSTTEVTAADNVTIDMPATPLNPVHTVAILTFKMTICRNANGTIASISYRDVQATNRDVLPEDLLLMHWATLNSPILDEAIDQYQVWAATRMENIMTAAFLANNPDVEVFESRYFRGLCYTTCIFKVGEVLKTAKTTCGDKCCKRVKTYHKNPDNPIALLAGKEYFETGATCLGNPQPPCENAIKITSGCTHQCSPETEIGLDDR
jgi:hypothetical protein